MSGMPKVRVFFVIMLEYELQFVNASSIYCQKSSRFKFEVCRKGGLDIDVDSSVYDEKGKKHLETYREIYSGKKCIGCGNGFGIDVLLPYEKRIERFGR